MTQFPPTHPHTPVLPAAWAKPHRGGTILALGIVGLVLGLSCGLGWILGIIAWVMANNDLREMDAGQMDDSGRGNTVAGKVCGIISVVLGAIGLLFAIVYVVIVVLAVGAAAAGGAGGPHP